MGGARPGAATPPRPRPGAAVIFDRDIRDRVPVPASPPPRPLAAAVDVGPVRWREVAAVARLQRRAFPPRLAYGAGTLVLLRLLPHVRFLVARRGGVVVGCAIGDRHEGHARVINLAVDPSARRAGIGTALLRALEAALPGGDVLLMVEADNAGAQALYRGDGYRPVGDAPDYYGRGRLGIWMRKTRGDSAPGQPPPPPKLWV